MEASTTWRIYPNADRQKLDALMECLAERLDTPKPDTSGDELVLVGRDEVTRALDECDPEWRDLMWPES